MSWIDTAFNGISTQLKSLKESKLNKNEALKVFQKKEDAFSGKYADLKGKPKLPVVPNNVVLAEKGWPAFELTDPADNSRLNISFSDNSIASNGQIFMVPCYNYKSSNNYIRYVATSTDGEYWNYIKLPKFQGHNILSAGNDFVTYGQIDGEFKAYISSDNGVTWIEKTLPSVMTDSHRLVYLGGKFILFKYYDYIIYISEDLATWTSTRVPLYWITKMTYESGVFVAVSDSNGDYTSGTYITSSDCITWSEPKPLNLFQTRIRDLIPSGEGYVFMCGIGMTTHDEKPYFASYSVNDDSWNVTELRDNDSVTGMHIALKSTYEGRLWIAFSGSDSQVHGTKEYRITYFRNETDEHPEIELVHGYIDSTNYPIVIKGDTLLTLKSDGLAVFKPSIVVNYPDDFYNGRWMDYGNYLAEAISPAIAHRLSPIFLNKHRVADVALSGDHSDLKNKPLDLTIIRTAATLPSSGSWRSVTYGNGKYVSVVYNSSKAAYSEDGINWTETTLPSSADWYSVTYGNGKFVAVAKNSLQAAYSTDGINWRGTTMPSSDAWHNDWCSVTYGNGKFVAVVRYSSKAAYSTDGVNWTETTLPSSDDWYSVTYGNGKFIAIASFSNKAAYSIDGINWIETILPSNDNWESVAYGNGKFVAVINGSDKAAYSTDGINWSGTTMSSSANWQSVTYGNGKFVAVAKDSSKAECYYFIITVDPAMFVVSSSTPYSTKKFAITVDDTGVISATEITE